MACRIVCCRHGLCGILMVGAPVGQQREGIGSMELMVQFDPSGAVPVGEVVTDQAAVKVLTERRVVLLPVDADRVFTPMSGYVRREWGRGVVFDRLRTERGCSLVMPLEVGRPWVYWAALVRKIRPEDRMEGQLRLVADGSQGHITGGLSQDRMAPLLEVFEEPDRVTRIDPERGFVVTGRCRVSIATAGLIGVSLYGIANNARVIWSAVSGSRHQVDLRGAVAI